MSDSTDIIKTLWIASNIKTTVALVITLFSICITAFIFHPALSQRTKQLDSENNVIEENLDSQNKRKTNSKIQSKKCSYALSLVIPAYNEEKRLPPTLASILKHLLSSKEEIIKICQSIGPVTSKAFEIIIVNDGSNDNTVKAVKDLIHNEFNTDIHLDGISIRLLSLTKNYGKGAAVKIGMLHANGKLCLMLDADNATDFQPSLLKLLQQMKLMKHNYNHHNICVFGSRAHLQEDSKAKRSLVRSLLMVAFHFFVKTLCSNLICDTQCGFKLFTQETAVVLFQNLHLTRWAFDTEVVVIAERVGIAIAEVGVKWEEVDGSKLATSKLALLIASVEMLRDMLCVNIMYSLGLWRLRRTNTRK